MKINGKELKDCIRFKEKRTFVLNVLCDCGGEFMCDLGDTSSIFSTLFSAVASEDEHKFNHKCRKCGKTAQFKHIFPCEKSFEVGLDTPKDTLATYVAESFEEELKDATGFEKSIG